MKLRFDYLLITIGILFVFSGNANSQMLFIGANYHPPDLMWSAWVIWLGIATNHQKISLIFVGLIL